MYNVQNIKKLRIFLILTSFYARIFKKLPHGQRVFPPNLEGILFRILRFDFC
jgi:hypothetical protein